MEMVGWHLCLIVGGVRVCVVVCACVDSKNGRVLCDMGVLPGTHGGVLNLHTEVFSVPHHAHHHHTQHTPDTNTHTHRYTRV